MRRTLAVVLGLAALLFLAPIAVAPEHDFRETGLRSNSATSVDSSVARDLLPLDWSGGVDVQPADDDEDDGGDDDGSDDDDDDQDDEEDEDHESDRECDDEKDEDQDDEDDGSDDEDEDGTDGDGEALSPSIHLSLSADTIAEGQSVLASWTVTDFTLDGAVIGSAENVPGRGHVHVLVDGELVAQTADGSLDLGDLAIGTHTIRVELHNNDHSALSPAVSDEATLAVTSVGPTAATVGTNPVWLFWILALLIAMIAATAAVLLRRRHRKEP